MRMMTDTRIFALVLVLGSLVACGGSSGSDTADLQRGIHQAVIEYSVEHKDMMPDSLGHLMVSEFSEHNAGDLLGPQAVHDVPSDFDSWDDEKKIQWVNTHSGFVYLGSGQNASMDSERVLLFELPASMDAEQVTACFEDGRALAQPYTEINLIVKEQTGHSIADWTNAAAPGAGQMDTSE